jgi:SET domain-containing protein
MLFVKTYLAPSKIDGLGLFADQYIPAGTLVWKFVGGVDVLVDEDELEKLNPATYEYFKKYAYLDLRIGKYIVCGDDARFVNHSSNPNLVGLYPAGNEFGIDVALQDIEAGEELTSDYGSFDAEFMHKLGQHYHAAGMNSGN